MRGDCAGNGNSFSNGPGGVLFAKLLGPLMAEIEREKPHWARLV